MHEWKWRLWTKPKDCEEDLEGVPKEECTVGFRRLTNTWLCVYMVIKCTPIRLG